MPSRSSLLIPFFIVSTMLFLFGSVHSFYLRLQSGDVYPEYSSLRSDPLGTRLLYESLEHMHQITVSRNLRPVSSLLSDRRFTVLFSGIHPEGRFFDLMNGPNSVDALIASGSRVVICFRTDLHDFSSPTSQTAVDDSSKKDSDALTPPGSDKQNPAQPVPRQQTDQSGFSRRWGFKLHSEKVSGKTLAATYTGQNFGGLPSTIPWHGGLRFVHLDSEWRIIYRCLEKPVVVERTFGNGTLVLATDSYLVSNEGLWRDRQPELLSWLIGPYASIVFDETHLGIREAPGVMSLVRQYHLEGILAGTILLAGLLIWKSMTSLVPPQSLLRPGVIETEFDSAQGFTNLLKRNIAPSKLLGVCIEQGTRSLAPLRTPSPGQIDRLRQILSEQLGHAPKPADIVRAYRALCAEMQPRAFDSAVPSEATSRLGIQNSKGDPYL